MVNVYNIIKKINDDKRKNNIEPYSVTYHEINKEVEFLIKQEINNLVKEKKIDFHQTLNSYSFDVIE